jgi:prevent-host-death family protein
MTKVPIHIAKTHLSRLVARACEGEEIVIVRGSVPAVRLVPVAEDAPSRSFGALRGKVWLDDPMTEPLPEAELVAWEGG